MYDGNQKFTETGGIALRRESLTEGVKRQIQEMETKIKESKELLEILESEPKLQRAIELIGRNQIY